MNDLISRQAAIEAINHICPVDTEYDCALLDRVDVRCVLSDLPSAQPEPQECEKCIFKPFKQFQPERKKGKWMLVNDNNGQHCICSCCGEWKYHREQNYCGHCGADLREEKRQ